MFHCNCRIGPAPIEDMELFLIAENTVGGAKGLDCAEGVSLPKDVDFGHVSDQSG